MLTRRHFGLAASGLSLLAVGGAKAAAPPATPDSLSLIDPELRPIFARVQPMIASMDTSPKALPQWRQRFGGAPPLAPDPKVEERHAPGLRGAPPVRVFTINAQPGAAKPAVLHIHGGGLISGTAAGNLRSNQELAKTHDCVVVSVDYRLAPETRFPGPVDDCYAALLWVYRNAAELGIDRNRIVVKGESAGGGLAAMLTIAARDRGEAPLRGQILIYPMLDDRTGSVARPRPGVPYFWTPGANVLGWSSFLGVPAGSGRAPAGSVPARVANLAGLPPAFVGVGSIDLFACEDIAYARRLLDAGVPTELLVVPGAFHAFDELAPQSQLTKLFRDGWNMALALAFRTAYSDASTRPDFMPTTLGAGRRRGYA